MRVLQVITSLLAGGAEKLVTEMALRMRAFGVETEVAVFNAVETPLMCQLSNAGVVVHRFQPRGGGVYSLANLLKLRKLAAAGGFDVIHAHNTAAQLFTSLCPNKNGAVFITTEHNTTNRRRGNPVLRMLDRRMYARFARIACISQATLDNLCDETGVCPDRCTLIPNGIDLSAFSMPMRMPDPDGEILIGMVAGFRKQKDQDTLLRTLAELPARFRLRLVGDGERRQALEALAAELGVADRVEFTGVRQDVPQLVADCHVMVMSSHYEGLSLSSVEGMAAARPMIASDVPGLTEVVGGAGILFPQGDARALARVIEQVCDNPDEYVHVVTACRERAAMYDIDAMVKKYFLLYEKETDKGHNCGHVPEPAPERSAEVPE